MSRPRLLSCAGNKAIEDAAIAFVLDLERTAGRTPVDRRYLAALSLPTLTLPYVVVMKLISARPQDSADISRMLGRASESALDAVRAVVKRSRPDDVEDLEQMIVAGQLEFGPKKGK